MPRKGESEGLIDLFRAYTLRAEFDLLRFLRSYALICACNYGNIIDRE